MSTPLSRSVRIKINDPDFGLLLYSDLETPLQSKNVKSICSRPFKNVEITTHGDVIICCYEWLPVSIGNVLHNTLAEIWNGSKMNKLRSTILDGSYKYCNSATCHYLAKPNDNNVFIQQDKFVAPDNELPEEILLSVDLSCNLYCPSCRLTKQLVNDNPPMAYKILSNVLHQVFEKSHSQYIKIGLDGCGDVFSSAIYRSILDSSPFFNNLEQWPNIKFRFLTNGVMMTEKTQKRWHNLLVRTDDLNISIDAGNKESYDKVRLGGNWDILWKNIDCFYNNYLVTKLANNWSWQVVVQKDNYESIPALIERAYSYHEQLPLICLSPILNWGSFTTDEFNVKAVWQPTSSEYKRLQDILLLPIVTNYPRLYTPIRTEHNI